MPIPPYKKKTEPRLLDLRPYLYLIFIVGEKIGGTVAANNPFGSLPGKTFYKVPRVKRTFDGVLPLFFI